MTVKIQNNSEIQEFIEANTPTLSYTLQLVEINWNGPSFAKTEETVLQNKKTNEEFSVRKKGYNSMEIKRATKKAKIDDGKFTNEVSNVFFI